MLYKDLLDGMLLSVYPDTGYTYGVSFPCVFERTFRDLFLDPDMEFSEKYLEVLHSLEEPSSTAKCRLSKGLNACRTLRDLVRLFFSIVRDLGLGDPARPECGRVSPSLKISYVYQDTDKIPFSHDEKPSIRYSGGRAVPHKMRPTSKYDLEPLKSTRKSLIQAIRDEMDKSIDHQGDRDITAVAEIVCQFDRIILHQRIHNILNYWFHRKSSLGLSSLPVVARTCSSCPFAKTTKVRHAIISWPIGQGLIQQKERVREGTEGADGDECSIRHYITNVMDQLDWIESTSGGLPLVISLRTIGRADVQLWFASVRTNVADNRTMCTGKVSSLVQWRHLTSTPMPTKHVIQTRPHKGKLISTTTTPTSSFFFS
jgi:hypothetical protein